MMQAKAIQGHVDLDADLPDNGRPSTVEEAFQSLQEEYHAYQQRRAELDEYIRRQCLRAREKAEITLVTAAGVFKPGQMADFSRELRDLVLILDSMAWACRPDAD